ncbi:MAG: ATPase, partial [Tepidanaerobacteraceae bacterium]
MTGEFDKSIDYIDKYTQQLIVEHAMKKSIKEKLEKDLTSKENELEEVTNSIDILEQVRLLLQRASEYAREQIKQQIEMLVTHCLQ